MSTEPPEDQTTAQRVTQIHRELREFKASTTTRFDEVDMRMIRLSTEIQAVRSDLEKRILESEVRVSTAIVALAGTLHDVHEMLRAQQTEPPRRTGPL